MTRRSGDADLARRLGAYAAVRLAPDAVAMARVRANVLATAASHLAGSTRPATPVAIERISTRGLISPFRRRRIRFEIGLLAATAALFLVVGGAAAAQAGGPLYGARIWAETLTLPADPSARTDAELTRLSARLQDARDAAARGDGPGVQAALQAYQSTVDEALDVAGTNTALVDRIDLALRRHLAVLTALVGKLPEQASATVKRVLAQSEATIDRIEAAHSPNSGGNAGGNGGAGASNGNAAGGSNGPVGSAQNSTKPTSATKSAKPTDPPASTLSPTPTARSVPTPSQGHGGGKPSPTPDPNDQGGHPTPSPHSGTSRP